MPKFRTETFGTGDMKWLGSAHGMRNARSGQIDVSTFTKSTHYPDNYFRSGTPVNVADEGVVKPWTAAAGETLGFILTDQVTDGVTDFSAPIFRHGIVNIDYVPVTFTVPTTGVFNGFVFNTRGA